MRSDLIERLQERADSEQVLGCVMIGVEDLQEAISALESLPKWVKCSERMPDAHTNVLVSGPKINGSPDDEYYVDSDYYNGVDFGVCAWVHYWMYSPAPPKVED